MFQTISIIGCNGAIGRAFAETLSARYPEAVIFGFSRTNPDLDLPGFRFHSIDYESEASIADAAAVASSLGPLDLVLVATGVLHGDGVRPEKSLKDLCSEKFQHLFHANTILPALIAKHFTPHLAKDRPSVFAALSARVGSISDNRLGGWYAYRASKAALNMMVKTTAIEVGRRNKQAIVVGLHPGTVASDLSKPFSQNVPDDKLFAPTYSAQKMVSVLEGLSPSESGGCFAWDGTEILP